MDEYFTSWILTLFILKYILQYLNFDISNYINLYYLSVILLYGYIIFIIIDMNIKDKEHNIHFYILNGIIHALPLMILCLSGGIRTKYAFETFFALSITYVIYLTCKGTDIVTVYTDDRGRIRGIDEIMGKFNI